MKNPIVARPSADPWVVYTGGFYWYCYSKHNTGVYIVKSKKLGEIGCHEAKRIWSPPSEGPYSKDIWAPELHYLMGNWYIYVACDDGKNENHRMYVLQGGNNENDPLEKEFTFIGKITDPSDKWAIDATILKLNEKLYFVWSGWEGNVDVGQNLYIAPMSNPYTVSGERVLIAVPDKEWEKHTLPLLEGPVALQKEDKTYIIYSGSASWTRHYCLGILELIGDDPLNSEHWKKHDQSVFKASDRNNSLGVGHCSFVKSPDQKEDWIVYHGMSDSEGWEYRDVRIQKFNWDEKNFPLFGEPEPVGIEIEDI